MSRDEIVGTELAGKVAVVTGAASGIGLSIARHAARIGMQVVVSDIEEEALAAAVKSLTHIGRRVVGIQADVADLKSVRELARKAEHAFGPPWLIVNNAGVSMRGRAWQLEHSDWEWVVGVNLWGVIHGLETFLPGMVERGDGYVVNTSSIAGLVIAAQTGAAYAATKHAIIGLSEALYRELQTDHPGIGVSVLCPGPVATNIESASRNRPERYGHSALSDIANPSGGELLGNISADVVGDEVFKAIVTRNFWILTHADQFTEAIRSRAAQVCNSQNPDEFSQDPIFASINEKMQG